MTKSHVVTAEQAVSVTYQLILASQWFEVEPLPDDLYEIKVKLAAEFLLLRYIAACV